MRHSKLLIWRPLCYNQVRTSLTHVALTQASDDRLLSASSPWAEHVSLHVSTMDGNISRMSDLDALLVPAHGQAEFAQGNNHLMFTGLYAPFVAGDVVPVTLHFERAGMVQTALKVRTLGHDPAPDHSQH